LFPENLSETKVSPVKSGLNDDDYGEEEFIMPSYFLGKFNETQEKKIFVVTQT